MLLPKKIEGQPKSQSHPAVWFRAVMILAVIGSGLVLLTGRGSSAAASGTISGTVFQDYNGNGVRDTALQLPNNGSGNVTLAVDRGVSGVTVTAYSSTGASAGSAVTAANGSYSINTAGSTGPYRVEFTNLPAGFYSGPFGANSGTTVQFVPEGSSTGISLGIVFPADYSQNNPTVAIQRYVVGDQAGKTTAALIGFPYTAGSSSTNPATPTSTFDAPPPTTFARAEQIGATWGIAWSRGEARLYVGAFMKKYSGFGPGGTGAIYRVDPLTQTVTLYADLNALFGAGTAGIDRHNFADLHDNGNLTWDDVGKVGLGGMAISDDGTKLFVMNLANKTLYELPIGVAPSVANIRTSPIPANPPGCTVAADVRPFAVQFYRSSVYVGLTCTGESTTNNGTVDGDPTQLIAHVYTVNPATLAFGGSPVHTVPLNYPRGCGDSAQLGPACFSALWKPWTPVYRNIAEAVPPPSFPIRRVYYPQPWLTALDFDNGNLILGIRDRLGDQTGLVSLDNPATNDVYFGVGTGDILRACGSPNTWTTESNARCGGLGTGPQGNGEGPGGGEYYFKDNSPVFHRETVGGGQLQVPGHPDVIETVIHPVPYVPVGADDTAFDGGVRWFVNGTGDMSKSYRINNDERLTAVFFGKANGLGDMVALVDNPQSEIGNFVWYDVNKNGIQDPGEPPIPGVTVELYAANVLLGSQITNGVGQYYFNSSNVAGGIQPGIAYEIRIALASAALVGKQLTIANAGNDIHDSDGVVVGGNAVAAASIPVLGANDHTFDFGFIDAPLEADLEIRKRVAQNCVEPGDRVTYTVTVINNGPAIATGVVVTDDLPFGLIFNSATPSQGSCNSADPMTCNLGSLGVGQTATITIVMTVPNNPPVKAFTNRATVTGNQPDPNPTNNSAQATACLIMQGDPDTPVGPGAPFPTGAINDQKAGSLLFYNYYTSSGSLPTMQNTRINMTNVNPAQFVFVHLFFIDGATCGVSDRYVCLTANQTLTFLMSDLDPGTTGYFVGFAVDDVLGCSINFNYLIGDAYIKTVDGHQTNLLAEAISRIPGQGTGPVCNAGSVTANLIFDGSPGNYERVPRVLAASSVMDYNSGNRQLLIINRVGGDFMTTASLIPPIFGILYNNQEEPHSFNYPGGGCQLVRVLNGTFPKTAPPFPTVIGPGTTGWMKFWATDDVGLMGAIINYNPNTLTTAGAFNQGRNLHKLTFATSETIRVPVFPPH